MLEESEWILLLEFLLLLFGYAYARRVLIPSYFGNVNPKIQAENIEKAKRNLNLLTASVFLYMSIEYLGYKAYLLHIVASVVMVLLARNMIRPFTLKRWGRESFRLEEVKDEALNAQLFAHKGEQNRLTFESQSYFYKGGAFFKQLPSKRPTSKSEFWAGFFAVLLWAFLVINLVYILKVEMNAPEIMVTLLAFIIAYVLSPFYPDLYTTFVFAQDEEVDFEQFVSVEVGGKHYFGSIEKLTFFKIAIKDAYNETIITFFHKLFLNAVMTSYPTGRFIEKEYVLSSVEELQALYGCFEEILPQWRKHYPDTFEKEQLHQFDHAYGYGVKLRMKVKVDKLKQYGSLKDALTTYIVQEASKRAIDLRTPILEVGMRDSSVCV